MSEWSKEDQHRLDELDDAVSHGALELGAADAETLESDMMWLIDKLKKAVGKRLGCVICGGRMSEYCVSCEADDSFKNPPHIAHRLRCLLNELKTVHHNWDNLAHELVKMDEKMHPLVDACQLVMGRLGGEEGYNPHLGGPATEQIRAALRNAGVETIYYDMMKDRNPHD